MNEKLRKLLEAEYRDAVSAREEDAAEAENARAAGVQAAYFDLMVNAPWPDVCWALERWDEAKQGYRQNADVMIEARAWHAEHSRPDYPLDISSDRLAASVVRAGNLAAAPEHLKRAVAYWEKETGNALTLSMLGLHAAQAGVQELSSHAKSIVAARQEFPGGEGEDAARARALLHYEPAQVALMSGRWDEFEEELKAFEEGARLVEGKPGLAFPEPLQGALAAAARGLRALSTLRAGGAETEAARETARAAFEEAMSGFYEFGGEVDWNMYFMRLNTRFADDLAAGRPPNPNPFAD